MPDYTLSAKATFDGSNFNSGVSKSTSALDKFKSKCDSVSSKTSGSFGKIVKAAAGVTTALAGIGTGLILKGGIDRALNIEQAQYKLKQLGLDVNAVMASADKAVQGTAHSLDQAVTVASSLGASGVQAGDEMTNALQAVAGMATISGRSMQDVGLIFGKVAAQGRVQGDELMQFAESGLDVTSALAKHFGTTQAAVREMVTAGKVDFKEFAAAMHEAYGEAAYGANETFQGALANTQAALSRLGEKFAKPALESLKGVFQNAIPAINALTASLDPAANKFGEFTQMIGERVSGGLTKFVEVLNQTQSPLAALKAAITETFGSDWGGAINAFVDAFTSVCSVVKDAIQWFVSLDSGTQVAIAQFVVFAAAARPLAGILANIVSKGITVVRFFSDVGNNGMRAAIGARVFGDSSRTAASAAERFASSAQSASSAARTVSSSMRTAGSGTSTLTRNFATLGPAMKQFAGSANASNYFFKQMGTNAQNASTKMQYLNKVWQSSNTSFRTTGAAAQQAASGFKSVSTSAQTAASSMSRVNTSVQTVSTGMRLASGAVNLFKGALMSIGAGLVIGAAFAGIGAAIGAITDQMEKARVHSENLEKATTGLTQATRNVPAGAQASSSALDKMSTSSQTAAKSTQELLEAQAQIADSMVRRNETTAQEISTLKGYQEALEQFNGQQLNEEGVARFKLLVDEMNQALGTTYEVGQNAQGAYVLMADGAEVATQSVQDLIEAKMLEAQLENAKSNYADAKKAEADAAADLARNTKELNDIEGRRDELMHKRGPLTQDETRELGELNGRYNELTQNISDNNKMLDAATQSTKAWEDQMLIAQEAMDSNADAYTQLVGKNQALISSLAACGQSSTQFRDQLRELGYDTNELATITDTEWAQIAATYDGTKESIVRGMEEIGRQSEEAARRAQEAIQGMTDAFSQLGGGDFSKFAEQFGTDAAHMAQTLNDWGITAEQVSNMTTDTFQTMAEKAGISLADLAARFQEAGVDLPDAVDDMVNSVNQATESFSNLGENADFSKFAQSLGIGMDEAAATFSEKCGQLGEVSTETVQQMADAFGTSKEAVAAALSAAGVAIPDEVRKWGENAAPAAQDTGQGIGEEVNEGASQSATDGGETVVQGIFDTAQGHEGEFQSIGLSLGNSLSTGFAQADMMSAQTAIQALVTSLSTRTAELTAIGTSWGNALSTGFSMADMMSTQTAITTLITNLSMRTVELQAIGTSWGNALSTGFAMADMMSTSGAITMFIANLSMRTAELTAIGVSWGNALSTGFATADMMSTAGAVTAFIANLSSRTGELNSIGVSWGNALSTGFASADMMSSGAAIQGFIASLSGYEGQFNAQGVSYGNALSTGFASADMASAAAAISSLVSTISGHQGEFQAAGAAAGAAYASGFASANVSGAASAVSGLLGAVTGMSGQFQSAGSAAGNAYTSGFSSANVQPAVTIIQDALAQIEALSSQFETAGSNAGNSFAGGINSAAGSVASAAASYQAAVTSALAAASSGAFSSGSHVGSQFAAGISSQAGAVAAAAASLAAAAKANIGHSKPKEGPLRMGEEIFGKHLDMNFAKGIEKNKYLVVRATERVAQDIYDRIGDEPEKGPLHKGSEFFGTELDKNFAKGIDDGKDLVEKSSEGIAQTVYDYIGHSNPAKGPLSCGEWVFGVHAATNFAEGLGSAEAKEAVASAAEELADAAAEAWTRGLLAAYEARSGVFKDIANNLAGVMESAFAPFFAEGTWASVTGGKNKNVFGLHNEVYSSLERIHREGYGSLKEWRDKEAELDKQFADDQKRYAEGVVEYDKKIAKIRSDAERDLAEEEESYNETIADAIDSRNDQLKQKNADTEKIWREYNKKVERAEKQHNKRIESIIEDREEQINRETEAWQKEVDEIQEREQVYKDFKNLRGELATDDYIWLAENEPLFDFAYEITLDTNSARREMTALAEISKKTGVVFSKEFVERIADGSEESLALLENLSRASADDVRQITLAYEDLSTQQRMADQAARELWVNSLQYQKDKTRQMRDLFLDYKDTVLDVKEALYSDAGLSNAFKMAGVSAEGFALDLESVDYTMTEFVKDFENFSGQVSNGFQAMNSYKQTTLNDWMKNLKQNMAESQAYAKNLQSVMEKLPDTVDSDAFRKAVLAGGWSQWGHVIADLAKADAGKVQEAVELYNASIIEGQQSAIEQFSALAPGEEYVNAFMDSLTAAAEAAGGDFEAAFGAMMENAGAILAAGLDGSEGQVQASIAGLMQNATSAMQATSGDWQSTGSTLAKSTADGITAQTGTLVSAATAAVQAAVAAAQQAAAAGMAAIRSQLAAMERETSSRLSKMESSAKRATRVGGKFMSIASTVPDTPIAAINALPELPNYTINTRSATNARGVSNTTTNTYGDVNVSATVRNDGDIRKLARELKSVWDSEGRAKGLQ